MAKGEIASRIQQDTIAAMKARDKERLGVLRMLQSSIKQAEVDGREELDETGVLKALSVYAKKVRDQVDNARNSGRDDLLALAEKELAIVTEFLPAELSDQELQEIINQTIAEMEADGLKDMGRVIKAVMPKVVGRATGGRVSALVKKSLQT